MLLFGPFRLDPAERQLWRGNEEIALTPKGLEILLLLVRHPGQTLTKEEFMRAVWPDTVVEESNLTDNISTLRQILGDDAKEPMYIRTVPKRGYKWVGTVETLAAATAKPQEHRSLARRVSVVLVAALILAALVWLYRGASASPYHSVAVLPIQALSGTPDDAHLGLGLTDAVITRLSNVRDLAVRPTSAVLRYTGGPFDAVAAGREQEADAVVEGTLHRDGSHVRVNVRLVRTSDGRPLWAGTFDDEFTTLFALQDSIAEKLADALSVRLSRTPPVTRDPEAYFAYLEGRSFWSRMTQESLQRSIALFHAALRRDPQFAAAWAALADTYNMMAVWNYLPPHQASPQASFAARRALDLDPDNAEALRAAAYTTFRYGWKLDDAERQFRRAVAVRPADPATRTLFAEFLTVRGRFDEAERELAEAAALDPTSLYVSFQRAVRFYMMRRYPEALAELEKTVAADSSFIIAIELLWAVRREMGNHDESVKARVEVFRRSGIDITGLMELYERSGIEAYRRREIELLVARSRHVYVPSVFIAMNYTFLGDKEAAFEWLEKAHAERSGWLTELALDPAWDPLRGDSRFEELVKRIR